MKYILTISATAVLLLASCTARRTASAPVPDGDTIDVVIPESDYPMPTDTMPDGNI